MGTLKKLSVVTYSIITLSGAPLFSQPASDPGGTSSPHTFTPVQIQVKGEIFNATTQKPERIDTLSLIENDETQKILHTLKNPGSPFVFPPLKVSGRPLVLRASYKGLQFSSYVLPSAGEKTYTVTVLENVPFPEDGFISPALQVTRNDKGLTVTKVYIINNPAKNQAYSSRNLKLFVPENARNIFAGIDDPETKAPFTVALKKSGNYYSLNHALVPGRNIIYINFSIDGPRFSDRFSWGEKKGTDSKHNFMVLLWRPTEIIPEIKGGSTTDISNENMGRGIQVTYPTDGSPVYYDFSKMGPPVLERQEARTPQKIAAVNMESYNPIFSNAWKTILGLVTFLALIFGGVFLTFRKDGTV